MTFYNNNDFDVHCLFLLQPLIKKWKDKRYKTWTPDFSDDIGMIPETPETEIEVVGQLYMVTIY